MTAVMVLLMLITMLVMMLVMMLMMMIITTMIAPECMLMPLLLKRIYVHKRMNIAAGNMFITVHYPCSEHCAHPCSEKQVEHPCCKCVLSTRYFGWKPLSSL